MDITLRYFIVGYMASGKTTFGRALARKLGWQFIDLDFYIEQRFRKSIPQLFAERGEEGFRELERSMLREVGEFENVVISCGGGTPCFCENMDYMLIRGRTVWLDTEKEIIIRRLVANNLSRPLMSGKTKEEISATVEKGLTERTPQYERSAMRLPGGRLENTLEIEETVADFLKLAKNH